jgi:hypothetical protein
MIYTVAGLLMLAAAFVGVLDTIAPLHFRCAAGPRNRRAEQVPAS